MTEPPSGATSAPSGPQADTPPAGGCVAHGAAWLIAGTVIVLMMAGISWFCFVLYRLAG